VAGRKTGHFRPKSGPDEFGQWDRNCGTFDDASIGGWAGALRPTAGDFWAKNRFFQFFLPKLGRFAENGNATIGRSMCHEYRPCLMFTGCKKVS
jgi:hypothetical protein